MSKNKKTGLLGTLGLVIGASAAVSGLLLHRWAKSGKGEIQLGGMNGKGVTLKKLENGSIVIHPWQTVTAEPEEDVQVIELNEEDISSDFEDTETAEPEHEEA